MAFVDDAPALEYLSFDGQPLDWTGTWFANTGVLERWSGLGDRERLKTVRLLRAGHLSVWRTLPPSFVAKLYVGGEDRCVLLVLFV